MAKLPVKGRAQVMDIDPTLLSDEVKASLRAKALERVNKERADAAMDAFLATEIEKARRSHMPSQEMKYISLDLAGHSDRIMLDGTVYFHGQTYEVPKSTYDVLREVVSRGWQHEDEIGGANSDVYRRPRATSIGMQHANTDASQIMYGRR